MTQTVDYQPTLSLTRQDALLLAWYLPDTTDCKELKARVNAFINHVEDWEWHETTIDEDTYKVEVFHQGKEFNSGVYDTHESLFDVCHDLGVRPDQYLKCKIVINKGE